MSEQLSLDGFSPAAARPTDRLFFAIQPNDAARAQMVKLTTRLRGQHGLKGAPIGPERLHCTLNHLGDHLGLPQALVDQATAAAASVVAPAFDVVFDHVASFARPRKLPLVLRGGDALAPLMAFQRALGAAMARVGLGRRVEAHFTPHVTLLYDDKPVAQQGVEPIGWSVHEFVLVHSLLGQTVHKTLARWPLQT
jgi:RNA 2',3'-cyclic 3'-phosphodiesterase